MLIPDKIKISDIMWLLKKRIKKIFKRRITEPDNKEVLLLKL